MKHYVPPNGFIGAGSQTQAAQLIELGMPRNGNGNGNGTRRRKRKAKAAPARKKRATVKRSKRANGKRMVKGSAAAKAYMAKIRRKRKR